MAKKTVPVEEERTLLVSLGILYEVDSRILQLFVAHDNVSARNAVVGARQKALKQVVSRYIQGLETGTDAVSALSNMYYARLQLDVAQTDYQSGIYELQAAALLESPVAAPEPQAHPLPTFKPAPTVANLQQILESVPPTDLRQFPELEGLLNTVPDDNSKK
jgi:outer membrane protein TolC